MFPRSAQHGFTLIELVVVIVILGILAAFALPRFVSLQTDARTAATNALTGSLRSASSLVHGKALAQNVMNGTITTENQPITVTSGYPTGNNAGIVAALQDTTGFTITSGPGGIVTFTADGAPTPANCYARYQEPAMAGNAPIIPNAVISGC